MRHQENLPITPPILAGGSKYPTGHFMQWLKDKIASQRIIFDFSYQDKQYLLDAFDEKTIETWKKNPKDPIIISAQTGAGKNTFIQKVLLPYVNTQNTKTNSLNRILILSNRVALNRQTKLKFQEEIKKFPSGIKYIEALNRNYTQEGKDNLCLDFGPLMICSYQQFYERKILDYNSFSFIICDEFHFFTSDAPFYKETDKLLQEIVQKGQEAIRIYMSATPEIAIEAILRCEYDTLYKKNCHGIDIVEFNELNNPNNYEKSYEEIQQGITSNYFQIKVKYYHFKRNYNYIKNFFSFNSLDSLLPIIKSSSEKWLIFVSSKRDGEQLCNKINEECTINKAPLDNSATSELSDNQADKSREQPCENKKNKAFFISRKEIKENGEIKEMYNKIINDEHFDCQVLISTSVLDNGINIDDAEVKHIVIDYFNQPEFVQMLGRIRIDKSISSSDLSLYIHDFSPDVLKKQVNWIALSLLIRLYNDRLSREARKEYYDKHMKYLRHSDNGSLSEYNTCAIYQEIQLISQLMKFIKQQDNNFHISFGKTSSLNESDARISNARMYDLLSYYKDGEGQYAPWSRSFVDLFETAENMQQRIQLKNADIMHNNYDDNYYYSYETDFSTYLISTLIVNEINKSFDKALSDVLKSCPQNVKLSFDKVLTYQEHIQKRSLSLYEKALYLHEKMREEHQALDLAFFEKLNNDLIYYHNLLDSANAPNSRTVQLGWLGLPNISITPIEKDLCENQPQDEIAKEELQNEAFYNQFIKDKAVTSSELEQHRTKAKNKAYEVPFLESHAILCKSADEKMCARYFGRSKLSVNSKNESPLTFSFNNVKYTLKNVHAARNKDNTFYIWIKPE